MGQTKRFWTIVGATAVAITGTTGAIVYAAIEGHTEKFYNRFVLPVFHRLDPETSHKLAIHILRNYYVPLAFPPQEHDELKCNILGVTFKNPIGLAAGFDKDAEGLFSLSRFGFGFLEIGSVTPNPQPGNDKPRVFRLPEDKAIINRYGFNSDGHWEVMKRLRLSKMQHFVEIPVGVNLGVNKDSQSPIDDYVRGIRRFSDVADYFVINVSSPNTSGLRDLQKKENLEILLKEVLKTRNEIKTRHHPFIFLKLSPDLSSEELQDIAAIIQNDMYRVDGLIISNTTVQRDPGLKSPHKTEPGGLSGLPLKKRSTEMIAEMYKLTKGTIPIIGVGGIFTGEDAYEKIKAGATAVQIYTSFIYYGGPIVNKIKAELVECLKKDGILHVTDAVGKDVSLE